MEQYGFFVNTDICTGCKACMTSCFDRNDLEVPAKFRKVYEFGGGEWTADEAGAFTATAFTYYASMTCGHCESPACVAHCPTCAKACPVRALEFGPIANLREAHPEGAAAIGELTDETGPAVVFALHRDADKGGTLRNPQEVGHEA